MRGTAGSFLSAKRGESSGCDMSFAFPTVDGEWFSLSSFLFLCEECQKHSKQYIKHRQKRQWHGKKSQTMNLQWHTKHYSTGVGGVETKKRLKSKITVAWLKMKTQKIFLF